MHIIFDIGGTNIKMAASADLESFNEPKIFSTPKNFFDGLKLFTAAARELAADAQIKSLAGGIAGPVEKNSGKLLHSTNLPAWVGQPLIKIFEDEFKTNAFIYNDAAMAGLGEACAGAGRDKTIVAYITVGTGVGGARLVDKKLDRATFGFEPGHQIIDWRTTSAGEKNHAGHLDNFISGQSLADRFGRPAYELTDEKIWQEASKILAVGLYNTILHWSPEVVVLGGSMFKPPGILLPAVKSQLKLLMRVFPTLPEIKLAELGDLGGLHGAMWILKEKIGPKV